MLKQNMRFQRLLFLFGMLYAEFPDKFPAIPDTSPDKSSSGLEVHKKGWSLQENLEYLQLMSNLLKLANQGVTYEKRFGNNFARFLKTQGSNGPTQVLNSYYNSP